MRRKALGLSAVEVSRRVGQEIGTYRAWEKQFGPQSEKKYLNLLSQALSISEEVLTGDTEDTETTASLFSIQSKPAENLTPDQLAFLGQRAKAQRKVLKQNRNEASVIIGINPGVLFSWERSIPSTISQEDINAWEAALKVPNGWLLDLESELVSGAKSDSDFFINLKPAESLPLTQLDLLAVRARERRKALKLSRKEVALKAGISVATLISREKSIPNNIRQASINAWEAALEVPKGWVLNTEIEIPVPEPVVVVVKVDDSLTAAEEIRKIGCWIARKKLEKTMDIDQLTPAEARFAEMFALRYGVAGEEISTLKAVGDVFALTRERVRQIVDAMLERLQFHKFETPIIDKLFSSILTCLPATLADIDQHYRDQLGESLSVESLSRFSREVLGKGGFQITENPGGISRTWEKVVINPATHNEAKIRAIREAALDMIRSSGGAQVHWVAGCASELSREMVTVQDVLQTCRMITGFNWLVEEDGWFWLGESMPADNRVLTQSKKMLAVAGRRLDTEDIQQGLSRARRYYYDPNRSRPIMIEPPLTVVKSILSQVRCFSR
ncbi:helix-turn-helix domain-containing protein [Methylobacter luteus]|uniref:helix-turn-helix domain-containing protein n=1 Tax=Methylobacter luteus TaxID=415 RepID=UPI0018CA0EF4|nr:helix-turn-helix transcriptional regulator [Methylobacter luteus]